MILNPNPKIKITIDPNITTDCKAVVFLKSGKIESYYSVSFVINKMDKIIKDAAKYLGLNYDELDEVKIIKVEG